MIGETVRIKSSTVDFAGIIEDINYASSQRERTPFLEITLTIRVTSGQVNLDNPQALLKTPKLVLPNEIKQKKLKPKKIDNPISGLEI